VTLFSIVVGTLKIEAAWAYENLISYHNTTQRQNSEELDMSVWSSISMASLSYLHFSITVINFHIYFRTLVMKITSCREVNILFRVPVIRALNFGLEACYPD